MFKAFCGLSFFLFHDFCSTTTVPNRKLVIRFLHSQYVVLHIKCHTPFYDWEVLFGKQKKLPTISTQCDCFSVS